jgi:hypothetical protein
MNLNRTISAALAVAALTTYQAWAVDVPGAAQQGVQNATAPIQNQSLPNTGARVEANPGAGISNQQSTGANAAGTVQGSTGAIQQGTLNATAPNQIPEPSSGGVNVNGRMQGNFNGQMQANGQTTGMAIGITDNRPDPWRYKFENNRWWYWTPENRWMTYSDQYGWTYPESAGGYTTGYAPATAAPAVQYTVPIDC